MALICGGLFLYQSIILIKNYNSKDTFRTIREENIKGPMPSPLLLVCKDPGAVSISDLTVSISPGTRPNTTTIHTIATAFKVITSITWRCCYASSLTSYALKTQLKAPRAPYLGHFLSFAYSLLHIGGFPYSFCINNSSTIDFVSNTVITLILRFSFLCY